LRRSIVNNLIVVALTTLVLLVFQTKHIEWQTLVPLVTTKTEVEAKLGAPTSGKEYILGYDTTDARITVWYGGAKTSASDVCRWGIPNETVFEFVLAPKKVVRLADMNIDVSKFHKEKAPEMVRDYYYYNPKEGITITTRIVEREEVLLSIERGPNSAERTRYCCEEGKLTENQSWGQACDSAILPSESSNANLSHRR